MPIRELLPEGREISGATVGRPIRRGGSGWLAALITAVPAASRIEINSGEEDCAVALWKEYPQKDQLPKETDQPEGTLSRVQSARRGEEPLRKTDSLIAAGLTVEGKIEGTGHVRIAGRFKGDVRVEGDLTIEAGAHVAGEIRAGTILVGGEIHGNIQADSRVQLLESGTLIGDLKAGSLTVAAGSRMRGKVEFGWNEQEANQAGAIEVDEAK